MRVYPARAAACAGLPRRGTRFLAREKWHALQAARARAGDAWQTRSAAGSARRRSDSSACSGDVSRREGGPALTAEGPACRRVAKPHLVSSRHLQEGWGGRAARRRQWRGPGAVVSAGPRHRRRLTARRTRRRSPCANARRRRPPSTGCKKGLRTQCSRHARGPGAGLTGAASGGAARDAAAQRGRAQDQKRTAFTASQARSQAPCARHASRTGRSAMRHREVGARGRRGNAGRPEGRAQAQ